jgi:DNA-binding SARP family transcriptional activator
MVIQQRTSDWTAALEAADGPDSRSAAAVRVFADRMLDEQQALAQAIERLNRTLESLLSPRPVTPIERHPSIGQVRTLPAVSSGGPPKEANPARPPTLAVYCLGAFQLLEGGGSTVAWRAGKARTLFQYLVNHRGRPIAREVLMEALWPDADDLPAGATLKVVVYRLRKALGPVGKHVAIQAGEEGYQLDAGDLWLDVDEFQRLCTLGRRQEAEGRAVEAVASYARAAALYRGDFLEEISDEWVVLRRERLKDQYLLVLARLMDAALSAGQYDECIERCQQILTHDRCREQAYRALMLCHARLGHRSRVRRWYQVCAQTLRTELDVAPEPATEETYLYAMRGELIPSLLPVHPDESPSGNRGVSRLR